MKNFVIRKILLCGLLMSYVASPSFGADQKEGKKKMKPFADNNQDGKITAEDFPKNMLKKFKEYDLNSDGMIDPSEKQTFLLESKQKRVEGFENMLKDKDGDGKITKEDLPKKMQKMFESIDQDSDGVLSDAERTKCIEKQKKKMENEKSVKTNKKKKKKSE